MMSNFSTKSQQEDERKRIILRLATAFAHLAIEELNGPSSGSDSSKNDSSNVAHEIIKNISNDIDAHNNDSNNNPSLSSKYKEKTLSCSLAQLGTALTQLAVEVDKSDRECITRKSFSNTNKKIQTIFQKVDVEDHGILNAKKLKEALSVLWRSDVAYEDVFTLMNEFDTDGNGGIDISEFTKMIMLMEDLYEENKSFDLLTDKAVKESRKATADMLQDVSTKLHPLRDVLCIQEDVKPIINAVSVTDEDFQSAFAASEMRCLALVSHNDMKGSMKEFVNAHKNILKKFRLTGTKSTITMLKEIFKGDSSVVYGPSCSSGPLGGDAELVALLCNGKLGGIIFFQDPLSSHSHHSDIACLTRQALVHNTMFANTPTSAYMMINTLRNA